MANLQKLIDEITSLKIKISEGENVYNLEHYSQADNKRENKLKRLNKRALIDILYLTGEQIKAQITMIEAEHNNLNRLKTYFNEQYTLYFHGTGFWGDEFINLLSRYLTISFPDGKLNNIFTPEFMGCLSDAIMFKAAYLNGFIETVKQLTQQNPAAETPNPEPAQDPKPETTAEIIARILEPLKGAFQDPKHIDRIAAGLTEFAKTEGCTIQPNRFFATYKDINEFYEPFVNVWDKTGLSPANIGEVLTRFIFMHNGKREAIAPGTARKNIYNCRTKLMNRNEP